MTGGKQPLLLAVFLVLVRCQGLKVSMSPPLNPIFTGDLMYLSCDNSGSGSKVKWYFNNHEMEMQSEKIWKIECASSKHSGSYHCEADGQKSESISINVLEYIPSASLTIKTGLPVMKTNSSVVLQLDNEDGLQGWVCRVYRGQKAKRIILMLEEGSVSHMFQPRKLDVTETIFWCTDSKGNHRSNQVTVKTSEKNVLLEMNPSHAVVGNSLTLRCQVWGTEQITRTVFYKDGTVILQSNRPTYEIPSVADSTEGKYKCDAIFMYKDRTGGPPNHEVSDNQDLCVQAPPMKAVLSQNTGFTCSCQHCDGNASYRWYHKWDDGQPWALMDSRQRFMMPKASGIYSCRAVWNNKRSSRSNVYIHQSPTISILTVVVIILVILVLIAPAALYIWYKRRNTTEAIYEDVALGVRERGEDKYEQLQRPRGAQQEAEYDTLHQEAQGRHKKEGEYEPLKKEESQGGVYHTLGMEGAAGATGATEAYQALKKEEMKEGMYHTLGVEGAAGATGAYQALKKEGMKEGLYHTLGMEATGGEQGGPRGEDREYEKLDD